MMANLFIIFDPMTNIMNLSLNWLSYMFSILFIPLNYWLIKFQFYYIYNFMMINLYNEYKLLMQHKLNILMFISLFMFIFLNNFMSLFPYIFNSTSHMSINLNLSLPFWISFMLYGWINKYQFMFAHMIPQNTPFMLMSFMVLIETISNLIRPMTLSIRLMTNMIAGHLLLTLLGDSIYSLKNFFIILLMIQILLYMLELMVSMIQSYVFSILLILYLKEVN
uniref:ATP synthase subunit a n=1 Tax=Micropterix calthella TaxID=41027 RepID=A0A076EBD0_9NEOP|nr:ATP synthase F0 subunit 6 [Micropterix calthella]